ncbi:MAG: hypothetical protein IJZ34_05765 [Lachnospiraceae bacterium]|nr:hypothetical protein [Lachnospiraceae bacterium]
MLYKKNGTPRLEQELFRQPTAEYRGTPFWAWNCKLEQKELEWQLEILKQMGFGGAHMHVRTGMATPYLSEEYMELIKACVQKAKSEDMLAWLYDEDRWPSGAAGGLVTKDKRYRARHILVTPVSYGGTESKSDLENSAGARAGRPENGELLACYDVELNQDGYLKGWRVISEEEPANHEKWYVYLELSVESPWYNNQTYVNTLDKAAIDKFIEVTYESYNRTIAEEFDKTVPSIFTDEPQFTAKSTLKYATEKADVTLPWTDDLPQTFAAAYDGEDILAGIPELIWDRADGQVSVIRYHYHDHVCERFASAFADNCGKWCKEHGIELTGHVMAEPTLLSQTKYLGEAMRSYRGFGLPGIDMLSDHIEYTTAKQTQSAVHQYGREGMLSELYGVTNWDFDFRGHKLYGDWQAALGVTIRVPHLAWMSMAGEAKRDYPASISYQSPWWDQYSMVEDHFARTNTAMTRGKAVVKVGVIHPIESYWLHWGPAEQTALVRNNMDSNFQDMTKWLLFGGIDFDFISESLLPELCEKPGAPLKVGEMAYDVILVPGCETLRSTTLDCLESFAAAGGKLIFAGELPALENACPSIRGTELAKNAQCIQFTRNAILNAMEPVRMVEIRNQTGALTDNLLYQMRQDGEGRWLFIAHGKEPYNKNISTSQDLRIRVAGNWKVTLYNTMNGDTEEIDHCFKGETTEIYRRMYDYDSLLLWLEPAQDTDGEVLEAASVSKEGFKTARTITVPLTVPYTLSEPNALLLDQAEYALDDGEWQPREEILRLDDTCRQKLGWPSRKAHVAQPWVIEEEAITHTVHLRFRIQSAIEYVGAQLAIEDAERVRLTWNGQEVESKVTGWYVDKAIKTVTLPTIKAGENVLEASIPFGERTNVEWAYLLGDFGVEAFGRYTRIVPAREELAFGNITAQGLPFYGGNITYHVPVETMGGNLSVHSSYYKGVLQSVSIDGGKEIPAVYPPYVARLGAVEAGKHTVDIKLYGHRRNGFGAVHNADLEDHYISPKKWRTDGERWCYDYMLCEEGIITTPEIIEN